MLWFYILGCAILVYFLYEWIIRRPYISGIHKKYILITGCDTGFGRCAAKKFDELGIHVIAGCLTETALKELRSECSSRLLPVQMDVTSDTDVANAVKVITKHIPTGQGLHAVINNAGLLGPVGPLEWMDAKKMHFVLSINLYGMLRVTNAFLPLLKLCPGSRVVNTASVVGRMVVPNTGIYSISKHAVEAYSDQLRRELRPFEVSVHIIEPGAHMNTKFMEKDLVTKNAESMWNGLRPGLKEEYGQDYFDKMIYLSTKLIPSIATSTPDGVVRAYEHASFARFPKTRYMIGADSPLYLVYSYLPSRFQDWLISLRPLEPRPAKYYK